MGTKKFNRHTLEELTIQVSKARGEDGGTNYRVVGDVANGPFAAGQSGNKSPGDFARILKNANDMMANPSAELTNPATFLLGYEGEPSTFKRTMDAAYLAALMIHGAAQSPPKPITASYTALQYQQQAKTLLLTQAARAELDHTKYAYFKDGAGFRLSGFLLKMLYTYDYLKDTLSSGEKTTLNIFFFNCVKFYAINNHRTFITLFPDRLENNYNLLVGVASTEAVSINIRDGKIDKEYPYTHVNADGTTGDPIISAQAYYNNRRCAQMRLVGVWVAFCKNNNITNPSITLDETSKAYSLELHFKTFFKEFFKYGVFPTGMGSEFNRGIPSNPNKGTDYYADNLECMAEAAAALAKAGDRECVDYTTTDGIAKTKGTPAKGLKMAIETYCKMMNGTINRYYASVQSSNRYGNVQVREGVTYNYCNEIRFAEINGYYKSEIIRKTYMRDPTLYNVSYPVTNLGSVGDHSVFTGLEGASVGYLFCYGGMESRVDPYTATKVKQTITFGQLPINRVFGSAPIVLTGTAASGLPVTYSIVSGPGTIAGNTLTITGAGTILIRASQAGDSTYDPAPNVERSMIVQKAPQVITFPLISDKQLSVDTSFSLGAFTDTGLPIDYNLISGQGSILAGVFTISGVGPVTIEAKQVGTDNYKEIATTRTFQVLPAPPPPTSDVLVGKAYTTGNNGSVVPSGSYTNGIDESGIEPTEFYIVFTATTIGSGKVGNKLVVKFINVIADFRLEYKVGSEWVTWISATGNTQKERAFILEERLINSDLRFVTVNRSHARNLNEIQLYAYTA